MRSSCANLLWGANFLNSSPPLLYSTSVPGVLYWRASGGLQPEWIVSPIGLGFTIGAIAAILGAAIAIAFILPTLKQLEAISLGLPSELAPTRETAAKLQSLNRRLHLASLGNVLMLVVAVATMATARNWGRRPTANAT